MSSTFFRSIDGFIIKFGFWVDLSDNAVQLMIRIKDSQNIPDETILKAVRLIRDHGNELEIIGRIHECGLDDRETVRLEHLTIALNSELTTDEEKNEIALSIAERRNPPKRVKRTIETRPARLHPGFVYLLKSDTGHFKIGRTVNLEDRIKTFSVKLPFNVEYIASIKTDDMASLERSLHARYSAKRINGEWFDLDDIDVDYIKSLAGVSA